MKRALLFLLVGLVIVPIMGQIPNNFNYQASAWSNSGEILANTSLTIRFEILRNGEMIWQEDHDVTTNAFGQFSTLIGGEAKSSTGTVESFAAIDWGLGGYALKTLIDRGNGFEELGIQEFASVPYALYAAGGPGGTGDQNLSLDGTSLVISGGNEIDLSILQDGVEDADADPDNELITQFYLLDNTLFIEDAGGLKSADISPLLSASPWDVEGNVTTLGDTRSFVGIGTKSPTGKFTIQGNAEIPDEIPLFEVKNYKDEVVLSSYNNGAFINVENNPGKGVKGGFAVGGYNAFKAEGIQEFLRVTSDSVRVTFNEEIGKGRKGGFAVGGYNAFKAPGDPVFYVGKSLAVVNGTLEVFGEIATPSDERLKTNIREMNNVLEDLEEIRAVYFDWSDAAYEEFSMLEKKQIGVLAQEMERVYPELVRTNDKGYKMVDYSKLTPVLLQAIKEQQKEIDLLKKENERLLLLEERISKLENASN